MLRNQLFTRDYYSLWTESCFVWALNIDNFFTEIVAREKEQMMNYSLSRTSAYDFKVFSHCSSLGSQGWRHIWQWYRDRDWVRGPWWLWAGGRYQCEKETNRFMNFILYSNFLHKLRWEKNVSGSIGPSPPPCHCRPNTECCWVRGQHRGVSGGRWCYCGRRVQCQRGEGGVVVSNQGGELFTNKWTEIMKILETKQINMVRIFIN